MDKIIQLSRITRGGKLPLRPVDIGSVIKNMVKNYAGDLEIEVSGLADYKVMGDQFAIELILKNLMENTKHHSKNKKASFQYPKKFQLLKSPMQTKVSLKVILIKLGKLFYTNHSSRGSGIGLYLCGKLLKAMKSEINISYTRKIQSGI